MVWYRIIRRIIIWGATYFFKGYRYEQTNDAQVDAYLSPINAKVGGYISKIYYKDNQLVKKVIHLLSLSWTSMD